MLLFHKKKYQAAILQHWIWPSFVCKLAPFATTLNVNVSIFTLVAITLDRSYVILYPLREKLKMQHFFIIVSLIWILASLISSLNLFVYELVPFNVTSNETNSNSSSSSFFDSNVSLIYRCDTTHEELYRYYTLSLTIVQFALPISIFIVSYSAIYTNLNFKYQQPRSPNSKLVRNKQKVIKMIFIVLFIFIFCWSPLQIYNFLQFLDLEINQYVLHNKMLTTKKMLILFQVTF